MTLIVGTARYTITTDGVVWALGAPRADVIAMRAKGYRVRC